MELKVELGEILAETIMEISRNTGNERAVIFSEKEIKSAFAGSDFTNIAVKVPSDTSMELKGTVPAPEKQKAVTETGNIRAADFVTCTENSLSLVISPESMQAFVQSLPQESQDYFELLMAPVLTGEEMTPEEYIDLVASFYGQPLADELKTANIKVALKCPDGCRIKSNSSAEATFVISAADFLCLKETRIFTINW